VPLNNFADSLTVTGSSTGSDSFVFATSVVSGNSYSVSVDAFSLMTSLACIETNDPAGTATANMTDVAVTCQPPGDCQ
jgi:hypothetical protein